MLQPPVSSLPLGDHSAVNIDANGLASTTVHTTVEPLVDQVVDPLTGALLGLDTSELVHEVNCEIVEPVENLVDAITIPIVEQTVKPLLRDLGRLLFG